MEIINCVQYTRKRNSVSFFKETLGSISLLNKKRRSINNAVSYAYTMPTEKYNFSAGKVKEDFSLKHFLSAFGKAGDNLIDFVKINWLKSFLLLAVAALAIFISSSIYSIFNYRLNFTGSIILSSEDALDLNKLDQLMASFALEITDDFDQNGKLLNAVESSHLTYTEAISYKDYKVKSGDTISGIAKKFGLSNISSIISVNDIDNARQIRVGQKLRIPSIDGITYTVSSGDSIQSIAEKNNIKFETLLDVNELNSEILTVGQSLFLPGVGLDRKTLQSKMGELFILPISEKFRWSSPYGWRADPFTGVRSFHTGTDMACPTGTPILAAMGGRITDVGYNRIYGNYTIIDHGNGYQTLYAHQSKTISKKGQWVNQGEKIGLVGNTGYSTGPHLHFMVYKNGCRIDPMSVLKR